MRNWLGQDIVPGSVVYRGARDGNTSTYKVGVVESVNDDKGTARVVWKYEPGRIWRDNGKPGRVRDFISAIHEYESKGSPAVDTLIALDHSYLDYCERVIQLADEWKNGDMPVGTFKMLLEGIIR